MPLQNILIKPASGLCNMNCEYCFYCDEAQKRSRASYGMMSEETLRRLVKKVMLQAREQVCFAFQGGEPTLRGLDFFKKAVELQQRFNKNNVRVMNTLQTNGFQLDDEWCAFFREHHFLIGVSVDGTRELHDQLRHDRRGGPTYDKIRESIELLDRFQVEYNILTVVTRQTAENIKEIYQDHKKNGWRYQQYIACLDPLWEAPGGREYSLTPEIYGRFLTDLFDLWYRDWRRGKAPYIRQIENYIGIFLHCQPESCEQKGFCSVQCVTEADGSVYPCDFYVLDEYRLGNFHTDQIRDFFENPLGRSFVGESLKLPFRCGECKWYFLCRGGCRRNRTVKEEEGAWSNYFCRSYMMFFEKCADRMKEVAEYIMSSRI